QMGSVRATGEICCHNGTTLIAMLQSQNMPQLMKYQSFDVDPDRMLVPIKAEILSIDADISLFNLITDPVNRRSRLLRSTIAFPGASPVNNAHAIFLGLTALNLSGLYVKKAPSRSLFPGSSGGHN